MKVELDGRAMGRGLVEAVRGYVARSLAPIISKLQEIEKKIAQARSGEKGDAGPAGSAGPRGDDGCDGKDALELDILAAIDESKSYPRGTWARHANGLWRAAGDTKGMRNWECVVAGVAHLSVRQEDVRCFVVERQLSNSEIEELKIVLPVVLDQGVYRPESKYGKGDGVTFGGSWWIAQVDEPTDKPGISEQWRLAVKRGRDGKDK